VRSGVNHLRSSDLEWWGLKADDGCYINKAAAGGVTII